MYTCEACQREVSDNGPYELNDIYCCQDCMERAHEIGDMEYERQREDGI